MKNSLLLSALLVGAAFVSAPALIAQGNHSAHGGHDSAAAPAAGKLVPVGEKDAAWAAEARKAYPLTACVVADEKLGGMGKPAEFIYRVAGQPDRLVVFCCGGCEDDFNKDPAKFLAKIDAAKAKPAAGN